MNRRSFLKLLGAGAAATAATAVLPELPVIEPPVWVPKRTYFDLGNRITPVSITDTFTADGFTLNWSQDLGDDWFYEGRVTPALGPQTVGGINRLTNTNWIAREALKALQEQITLSNNVNRDYSEQFRKGDVISITGVPHRFVVEAVEKGSPIPLKVHRG